MVMADGTTITIILVKIGSLLKTAKIGRISLLGSSSKVSILQTFSIHVRTVKTELIQHKEL